MFLSKDAYLPSDITIHCPQCGRYGRSHTCIILFCPYNQFHYCPACFNRDQYLLIHDAHVQDYRRRAALPSITAYTLKLPPEHWPPISWLDNAFYEQSHPVPRHCA